MFPESPVCTLYDDTKRNGFWVTGGEPGVIEVLKVWKWPIVHRSKFWPIYELHRNLYKNCSFFVTVEQLSTSNISSTCPTGVNYISKYAGDLREKSHEVWTRNSNRSRWTAKKMTGGAIKAPPPNGIRVNKVILLFQLFIFLCFFYPDIMRFHCIIISFLFFACTLSKKNTGWWELIC